MHFHTMAVRNFLSVGDNTVNISLDNRGLVLIEGLNGAGKSTIAEALLWCLYGITMRGYEGDQVINRDSGENCAVSVLADAYYIVRSRKYDGSKASLRLYHDKKEETGPSIASTQVLIDKLVGMNADTFRNTVVFGQGAQYRFSTLSDREQKAVFDDALGIGLYADALEAARSEHRDLTSQMMLTEAERTRNLVQAVTYEATAKKHAETHAEYAATKATELARLTSEIRTRTEDVRRSSKAKKAYPKVRTKLVAKRAAEQAVRDRSAATALELGGLKKDLGTVKNALQSLTERRKEAVKRGTEPCKACGQDVDAEHLKKQLKELDLDIEEREAENLKLDVRLLKMRKRLKACEGELQETSAEAERYFDDVATPTARKSSDLTMFEKDLEQAQNAYASLVKKASPYETLRAAAARAAEIARMAVTRNNFHLTGFEERRNSLSYWVTAFGTKGLRSLIIDNVLPLLNEKANEYATMLSDGTLDIEFRTQSTLKSGKVVEKFEVAVTNTTGAEDYKGLSAGEKAKVDLCVGLALQHLVASRAAAPVNVAFFDEPFESLDDTALDRVVVLLTSKLKSAGQSIFVITHNENLKAYFPNVVTVSKDSTGTTLA